MGDNTHLGECAGSALGVRDLKISSAAQGGQVLVSGATAALVDSSVLVHLGEFRLTDLFELVIIFQAGSGEFPSIRALDPARHNLPVRFTSLIGRDELVDRVIAAIADSRLVTLVGPGGIGKTSVALEAGARLVSKTDRGVWLTELDRLLPGADVEPAIAATLGMAPIEGWRRTAADRDQLIVLDNAEHVIDRAAQAATALLRAGPAIRCDSSRVHPRAKEAHSDRSGGSRARASPALTRSSAQTR